MAKYDVLSSLIFIIIISLIFTSIFHYLNRKHEYLVSVVVSSLEREIDVPSSNSCRVCYIPFLTNTLWVKQQERLDFLALVGNQSIDKKKQLSFSNLGHSWNLEKCTVTEMSYELCNLSQSRCLIFSKHYFTCKIKYHICF